MRRAFAVDLRGNVRRVLLDLHRSVGLISLVAVIAVALSGIYLNLRQEFTAVVRWFSPVSATAGARVAEPPRGGSAPVGVEQAIALAEQSIPGARAQSIALNGQKAFYRVRLLRPGDRYERGDTNVYVSMQDGAILQTRSLFGDSAGDAFLGWQRPFAHRRSLRRDRQAHRPGAGAGAGAPGRDRHLSLAVAKAAWAAYADAPGARARRRRRGWCGLTAGIFQAHLIGLPASKSGAGTRSLERALRQTGSRSAWQSTLTGAQQLGQSTDFTVDGV